jgi:hypothetical protein
VVLSLFLVMQFGSCSFQIFSLEMDTSLTYCSFDDHWKAILNGDNGLSGIIIQISIILAIDCGIRVDSSNLRLKVVSSYLHSYYYRRLQLPMFHTFFHNREFSRANRIKFGPNFFFE